MQVRCLKAFQRPIFHGGRWKEWVHGAGDVLEIETNSPQDHEDLMERVAAGQLEIVRGRPTHEPDKPRRRRMRRPMPRLEEGGD